MMLRTLSLIVMIFFALPMHAENASLTTLRNQLVAHSFFIRGHNPETKIRWKLQDGKLITPEPKYHMVSVLQVSDVKLSGHKLRIEGTRRILEKKRDGTYDVSLDDDPIVMEIDLGGADLATVLPTVPQMIFYANQDEALEHTPISRHSKSKSEASEKQAEDTDSVCDCSDKKSDACHVKGHKIQGLTSPKLIHREFPSYSEEARAARVDGSSEIYFVIGVDGRPSDLWVIKVLGSGLDERAVDAARKYVFRPASCHGNPIAADVFMDVNFHIN